MDANDCRTHVTVMGRVLKTQELVEYYCIGLRPVSKFQIINCIVRLSQIDRERQTRRSLCHKTQMSDFGLIAMDFKKDKMVCGLTHPIQIALINGCIATGIPVI